MQAIWAYGLKPPGGAVRQLRPMLISFIRRGRSSAEGSFTVISIMSRCDHISLLRIAEGKEVCLLNDGQIDRAMQAMTNPSAQYPSLQFFIGRIAKDLAHPKLFSHNNVRRGPQDRNCVANLRLDASSISCNRPILFADSEPHSVIYRNHEVESHGFVHEALAPSFPLSCWICRCRKALVPNPVCKQQTISLSPVLKAPSDCSHPLLSITWVWNSLNLIAGKDFISRRTRSGLAHEVQCLRAGKKIAQRLIWQSRKLVRWIVGKRSNMFSWRDYNRVWGTEVPQSWSHNPDSEMLWSRLRNSLAADHPMWTKFSLGSGGGTGDFLDNNLLPTISRI